MDTRLKRYNDFSGIDREKPLGISFVWGKNTMPFVVFLPVNDIDNLLTTATFGVVGFHQVGKDHYEIERVTKPYQVLVRKGYAFVAESLPTIHAIRTTPDQITRRLRDRYDLAIHFDLRQIPKSEKIRVIEKVKTTVIPYLQTRDDETAESGSLRKFIGSLLLDVFERATIDANTLTVGIQVSPDDGHLRFEVEMEAASKSPTANACNQCSPRQSQFTPFLKPDPGTAAVAVMNFKVTRGMVQQFFGESEKVPNGDWSIDAVIQLVGQGVGDLSLLAAFKGTDVTALKEVLSSLLATANGTGQVTRTDETFVSYLGVNLHSLTPIDFSKTVTDWIGSTPEMILGQTRDTFWVGIGSPANVLDDLKDGIELAMESRAERIGVPPIVQVQIKGLALPQLVASNLLIPNMDTRKVREELARGEDGINMKVEPVNNGIKLTFDFEGGFVRLIGRDWVQQIESLRRQR